MNDILVARATLDTQSAESMLRELRERYPRLVIQLMSVRHPPSFWTVRMIGEQTLRAREKGGLLAAKPELDLLLRLSGTTQISVALKEHGYKASGEQVLVAVGPEAELGELRARLTDDRTRYALLDGDLEESVEVGDRYVPTDDEKRMVETAALLGTRT